MTLYLNNTDLFSNKLFATIGVSDASKTIFVLISIYYVYGLVLIKTKKYSRICRKFTKTNIAKIHYKILIKFFSFIQE